MNEEKEILYECLRNVILRYQQGLFTINDVIARISNEPLLSPEQKKLLISSPTLTTLDKVLLGKEPQYVVDNIPLPPKTIIVVPSKKVAVLYKRKYQFIMTVDSINKADIVIASKIKVASMLTTRKIPQSYHIALFIKPSSNYDYMFNPILKFIVAVSLAEKRNIISPYIRFLDPRIEMKNPRLLVDPDNLLNLSLSPIEKTYVDRALREYLNRGGSKEVLDILGLKEEDLPYDTSEWWTWRPFNPEEFSEELPQKQEIDKEKLLKLIEQGIRKNVARRLAQILSEVSTESIARAIVELKYHYSDSEVEQLLPIISSVFNIPLKTVRIVYENLDVFI